MGRNDEAIEAHQKLAEFAPIWNWVLGYTYALTDHRDEAEKILNDLENSPVNSWSAVGLSVMYGALGRMDEAFKWLDYEPHHVWIAWAGVMPIWKPLWKEDRLVEFVKRLNLPKV